MLCLLKCPDLGGVFFQQQHPGVSMLVSIFYTFVYLHSFVDAQCNCTFPWSTYAHDSMLVFIYYSCRLVMNYLNIFNVQDLAQFENSTHHDSRQGASACCTFQAATWRQRSERASKLDAEHWMVVDGRYITRNMCILYISYIRDLYMYIYIYTSMYVYLLHIYIYIKTVCKYGVFGHIFFSYDGLIFICHCRDFMDPVLTLIYLRESSRASQLKANKNQEEFYSLPLLLHDISRNPYGCFLKWWYPQNTPKWSFLVGKPMVVGYHHFRKHPYKFLLVPKNLSFSCWCSLIARGNGDPIGRSHPRGEAACDGFLLTAAIVFRWGLAVFFFADCYLRCLTFQIATPTASGSQDKKSQVVTWICSIKLTLSWLPTASRHRHLQRWIWALRLQSQL